MSNLKSVIITKLLITTIVAVLLAFVLGARIIENRFVYGSLTGLLFICGIYFHSLLNKLPADKW